MCCSSNIMIQKTLILVSSPLQALCAIEAIYRFNIKEFEIRIVGSQKHLTKNEGTYRLLEQLGFKYEILYLRNFWEIFKYAIMRKNRYGKAIIGNYIHTGFLLFAVLQMYRKGTIIYVDDGNSTFQIIADKILYFRFRDRVFRAISAGVQKMKQIKNACFYTYFDVKSDKWHIERNHFNYLVEKIKETNNSPCGIYLLGTNWQMLTSYLQGVTCVEILNKTIQHVRRQFPGQEIWFCPHRVDRNNIEVNEYLKTESIQLFDTEISVEFDFILKQIQPKCVIGFGSSALYSLCMMFHVPEIYTVKLPFSNKELLDEYTRIENDYKKNGIRVLDFFK